jgi:hypothetical protein
MIIVRNKSYLLILAHNRTYTCSYLPLTEYCLASSRTKGGSLRVRRFASSVNQKDAYVLGY